jgi:hypothetical protein
LKIYDLYYNIIHVRFFKNVFWIAIYFIVGIIGIIKLISSGFQNKEYLIVVILFLINFLAAVLIGMIEVEMFRYSFATEFCYYVSFALAPLLFTKAVLRN